MPKYVTILGTSHDLQGAEKRKSSVNDPTFSEAIEFLLSGRTRLRKHQDVGRRSLKRARMKNWDPVITWMLTPCVRIANDMELAIRVGDLSQLTFFMLWTVICARNTTWSKRKEKTSGCAKSKGGILPVLFSFADICTPSAWLSGCVTLDMSLKRGTTCHMRSSAEKNIKLIKAEARRWDP